MIQGDSMSLVLSNFALEKVLSKLQSSKCDMQVNLSRIRVIVGFGSVGNLDTLGDYLDNSVQPE